jgi:hypothetical protein
VLSSITEGLPLLRCVNDLKPDFLSSAFVNDTDGVPVTDTYDSARVIICPILSLDNGNIKVTRKGPIKESTPR